MMTDEPQHMVKGSSTSGESIGSVPLILFLDQTVQTIKQDSATWRRLHEARHDHEYRTDDQWRQLHAENHKSLETQLQLANDERRARDAVSNEWRAALNDMTARLPNRDVTDGLSERLGKLERAMSLNEGRDRAFTMMLSIPGIIATILGIVLLATR